ncbi:MAG: tetratricopeptide repeat protein [Candidatus Omnitrophica bacterium]|nr:tetratricopeptide repeat protein [Candidatus Omnitrophota bacterium]
MSSHRRAVLIIVLFCLATFGNSLSNGFVGDDHLLIVHNSFYRSWANFPGLFTASYITNSDDTFNLEEYAHTGSVAYRPVLSATFFLDHWLWQKNPFGYHLSNLAAHFLNSVLVYFIVAAVVSNASVALWGALLFAVHPLKTEAVCAIGYRADLLAALFFLLAFWGHISQDRFNAGKRKAVVVLSHAALVLALFSKESAVVFIALVMAFDWLVKKEKVSTVFKHLWGRYAGFVLITVFYLYVYLHVFPNSTLGNLHLTGGSWPAHTAMMLRVWWFYVWAFLWPPFVKALPPVYAPPPGFLAGYQVIFPTGLFVLFIYLFGRWCRYRKTAAFFLSWFLISYIPVSDIIPLVNPVAYRFMYLPSVGLLTALAIWADKALVFLESRARGIDAGKIIRTGVLGLCAVVTVPLNMAWKDNYMIASHMVRDFPQSPVGYLHLGIESFRRGAVDRARDALEKGFERGLEDPRGYYYMGLCFFNDFERSRPWFEKSISLFPNYALSYVGLGRIHVLERSYGQAIPWLKEAVRLAPSYTAYGYLIQSYLLLGRGQEAGIVLGEAERVVRDGNQLGSLRKLVQEGKNLKGPVDIGI